MRIYDLERDIKNLTLSIEELVFQIDEVNNRINKIEADFDTKLKNVFVENSKDNLNDIKEKEDKVNITADNSENSLGALKITSENNTHTSNEEGRVEVTNQIQIEPKLTNLTPESQFQIAFNHIRNKKYDEAKLSLKSFIKQNPESQLSGSAHYWLGELHLLGKNYREAALILAEGYQNFPKSIKAPDMLYRLSEALIVINKNQEACNTLSKLSKDFSTHKLKNKAEKKKLEISCDILSE